MKRSSQQAVKMLHPLTKKLNFILKPTLNVHKYFSNVFKTSLNIAVNPCEQ